MSTRLPYAAKQLIDQVSEAKKKAKVEYVGEPDGLRVIRTIKFDKATSKWLAPLMEEMRDERVFESHLTEDEYLHVTFVADRRADLVTPFPLGAAEAVVKDNKSSD